MRGRWLIAPLVVLAVLTVSGVDASRRSQPAQDRAPVFSSTADLVVVHVTVTDRRGAYVTDLPQEAFRIVGDARRRGSSSSPVKTPPSRSVCWG
jgi:hypothetical protein